MSTKNGITPFKLIKNELIQKFPCFREALFEKILPKTDNKYSFIQNIKNHDFLTEAQIRTSFSPYNTTTANKPFHRDFEGFKETFFSKTPFVAIAQVTLLKMRPKKKGKTRKRRPYWGAAEILIYFAQIKQRVPV